MQPAQTSSASATPSTPTSTSLSAPVPQIEHYRRFLRERHGLVFEDYAALWGWSVTELDAFWRSIWDHFDLRSATPFERALCEERMPGAVWFRGAMLNVASQALRHVDAAEAAGHPAIVHADEAMLARGELGEMRWPELRRQVGALAASLHDLGVRRGDRVVAYLPNVPATAVAFLAVASLGAVWSVCSPDMGPVAVLDRFRQIEPKVLIAADGVRYAGQAIDRLGLLADLLGELPTVTDVVLLGNLDAHADPAPLAATTRRAHRWDALVAHARPREPDAVPFDHPLWIVYSSGTTGLPKPIVHGHGGVMLEMLKGALHNNVGASADTGDRFHWYSSTGWIMWNCQVGALMGGTTICLFDGSPAGPKEAPDWSTLWRFVALSGATFFGAGAAFYASCLKAGVEPMKHGDLSRLRAIGSTGSPLADESYDWIWANCPKPGGAPIWICIISGGTDFAGAFLTGLITEPLVRGQMQVRSLGAAVHAFGEADGQGLGRPLIDEVGELVCARPMPSMPLYFWGDQDNERYLSSYFDMYRGAAGEGIWRHGDWLRITPSGGGIIYGRSDATINRHGIRMGTAELYRAVETHPEVLDSLVVDLEYLGRPSCLLLFVQLRAGQALDAALQQRLRDSIKQALSARHVPDEIHQVEAVPRTLSGKKMELPIKKLLLGAAAELVMKRDAMANAEVVGWYQRFASERQ
ncbi:acetoacetate--CoA ligase [Roseateles aquatilis]|uniref:Acetoacetate--CoA ligase n=1 Tax=Roseateles aquatilis TaxID=431061 RepID=A0A246J6Z4_9BURK|nr:acetoacetate--CoA ligase [Roseateles aquatilis]OWQ88420.1 acetoacetate--CoA ligase [Roseateles aquatilis]